MARVRRVPSASDTKDARVQEWIEKVTAPYRFPAEIATIIRGWGVAHAEMRPLVEFVETLRFQMQIHRERIAIGKKVRGWSRHSQREIPEEPGLLTLTDNAVKGCVTTIDQVLELKDRTLWVTDHRIERASCFLRRARKILSEPAEIEVFPDNNLPPRTKGRKPALVIVLQQGKAPQPVQRKTLGPALRQRLVRLCPSRDKAVERNRVLTHLIAFILPESPA